MVSDKQILDAYKMLAREEGIFAEPASAASVAGLLKLVRKGYFESAKRKPQSAKLKIVCVLTGHGLKDPDRAIASLKKPRIIKAEINSVIRALGI